MKIWVSNSLMFVVALAAAVAVGSLATAQPILPEMDSADFPDLADHPFEGDNAMPAGYMGTLGGLADTPESGILTLPHNTSATFYEAESAFWAPANDADGWTAEFRLKLDAEVVVDATHIFQMQWHVGDSENTAENPMRIYRFFKDRIDALGGGTITLIDGYDLTDDFHIFRVAQGAGDNTFQVWLDGIPLSTHTGGFSGANSMWFGCGGTGCNLSDSGDVQIDYYRWTGTGGFAPETDPTVLDRTWNVDGLGFWNDAPNWDPDEPAHLIPNGPLFTARFSSAITQPRTVITDQAVFVNKVVFNNANSYAIVGLGSVSLATSGGNATIEVLGTGDTELDNLGEPVGPGAAGHHQFQTSVNLDADTDVTIGQDASLSLNNSFTLGGNTLNKTGAGALYVNNALHGGSGGEIVVSEGLLGGTGEVGGDVTNASGGTVGPGNSPGHLSVSNTYTQESNSTLQMELGGTLAIDEYDRLTAQDIQINGGTLEVTLIDSFNPSNGDVFDLFNFFTMNGAFDTMVLPGGAASWDTDLLFLTGSMQFIGTVTPLEADFDEDGDVDGDDFLLWQVGFGAGISSGATKMDGDYDNDGDVDGDDFLGWQVEFPSPGSGTGSTAVPEPSGMALAALCLVSWLALGGRKMKLSILKRLVPVMAAVAGFSLCQLTHAQLPFTERDSSLFEHKYEGDVFNTAPPYIPDYTANGFVDPGFTHDSFLGVLTMDHYQTGAFFTSDVWPTVADDAGGWTFEAAVKLDPLTTNRQLNIRVGDAENSGPNGQLIYTFYKDELTSTDGQILVPFDAGFDFTDTFHVLRVTQLPGNNIFHAWLDGTYLSAGSVAHVGGQNMWFGGGGSGIEGAVEIDYVRFTGEGSFCPAGCDVPPPPNSWLVNASGSAWDDNLNWSQFEAPIDNTATAAFGGVITAGRTIIVDNAVTSKRVEINDNNTYNFAGQGSVNLEADAGNASIKVFGSDDVDGNAGNHQFQAIVNLASQTDVEVGQDASLSFNNVLNLSGNNLTKSGAGDLNLNNRVNADGGQIIISAGAVGGSGTIGGDLINDGGTVAPGNSPGVMTVEGAYLQGTAGKLEIEIGGLIPGLEYDVLDVAGEIWLDGGTLEVMLTDGFRPHVGDSFEILNFSSIEGAFDAIRTPGGVWDTSRLLVDGTLTLVAVPEPAALCLLAACLACLTALRCPRRN